MQEFINRSKHGRCISSVPQLNGNSIESFLSTQTRRVVKLSWTKSLQLGSRSRKGQWEQNVSKARIVENQKDRKDKSNSRRSRFTRESKVVKSKR